MTRPRMTSVRRREAFTLLELLLVLVILVTFLSVTWPTINRLYGDHELKQSALDVQNLVAQTRFHSLDSGLIYQFRYEPGGTHYIAVPFERDTAEVTAQSGTGGTNWSRSGELPKDIRFEAVDTGGPSGERLAEEFLTGLTDAYNLGGVDWSSALLFYPNGSASSASFDVVDERSEFVRLSVRDLTGVCSASTVSVRVER